METVKTALDWIRKASRAVNVLDQRKIRAGSDSKGPFCQRAYIVTGYIVTGALKKPELSPRMI